MTAERAAAVLAAHGHQCRPSDKPQHVQARCAASDWEDVALTRAAVWEWMGY